VEYQEVDRKYNKIKYFPEVIIRHDHPNYTHAGYDKFYQLNNVNEKHDQDAYNRRRALGFPVGIPKIAHFIWSEGTPLTYLRFLTYNTFKDNHPDWKVMFHLVSGCATQKTWKGTETLEFISGKKPKDYIGYVTKSDIVHNKVDGIIPNYASDLIRFESLYRYGGYYFDLDQLFCKSFNDLLDYDVVWGGKTINYSGVLGMFKGCPVAKAMYDNVKSKIANAKEYCEVGNWLWSSFVTSKEGLSLLSYYKAYITPMHFFYPVERSEYMIDYYKGKKPNLDGSYAIHWFGGHPDSQAFNSRSEAEINEILYKWQS
jgi:hypothetical protein